MVAIQNILPTEGANLLAGLKTGDRVGHWTILGFSHRERSRCYLAVRCDCGIERALQHTNLAQSLSRSCGSCVAAIARGERIRLPGDEGAIRRVERGYKRNATTRGLCWELTPERFRDLIRQPCFYCGQVDANVIKTRARSADAPRFSYNGIDRVNNDLGYTEENVVACCGVCNRCKNTLSADEFVAWAQRVADTFRRAA